MTDASKDKGLGKIKNWMLSFIKGMLIGVGTILPGISGGVLCVVFGIYRPMMELLSNPILGIKTRFWFFLPIGLGWLTGVLGLSRVVEAMFRIVEIPAIWLFIGLLVGTIPSLYKEAGQKGRGTSAYISMAAAFSLTLLWMTLFKNSVATAITPNLFWWLICGLLWGIGLVVPGMSPSSFFIYLGLYQPMTAGIANFELGVIIPILIGTVLIVILLARGIQYLIKTAYSLVFHAITGIVLASSIVIVPTEGYGDIKNIIIYFLCFTGGCVFAYVMERMGNNWSAKKH